MPPTRRTTCRERVFGSDSARAGPPVALPEMARQAAQAPAPGSRVSRADGERPVVQPGRGGGPLSWCQGGEEFRRLSNVPTGGQARAMTSGAGGSLCPGTLLPAERRGSTPRPRRRFSAWASRTIGARGRWPVALGSTSPACRSQRSHSSPSAFSSSPPRRDLLRRLPLSSSLQRAASPRGFVGASRPSSTGLLRLLGRPPSRTVTAGAATGVGVALSASAVDAVSEGASLEGKVAFLLRRDQEAQRRENDYQARLTAIEEGKIRSGSKRPRQGMEARRRRRSRSSPPRVPGDPHLRGRPARARAHLRDGRELPKGCPARTDRRRASADANRLAQAGDRNPGRHPRRRSGAARPAPARTKAVSSCVPSRKRA